MKKVLAIVVLLTLVAMVPVAEARRCGPKFIDTDTNTQSERASSLEIPIEGEMPILPRSMRTYFNPKLMGGYSIRSGDSHWFAGVRMTIDLWPVAKEA